MQIGEQKPYFWYTGLILATEERREAIAIVGAEALSIVASPSAD